MKLWAMIPVLAFAASAFGARGDKMTITCGESIQDGQVRKPEFVLSLPSKDVQAPFLSQWSVWRRDRAPVTVSGDGSISLMLIFVRTSHGEAVGSKYFIDAIGNKTVVQGRRTDTDIEGLGEEDKGPVACLVKRL